MKMTCFLAFAVLAMMLGTCVGQPCDFACQEVTKAYKQQLSAAEKETPSHPLDPLTWTEADLAKHILYASDPFTKYKDFAPVVDYIVLLEPAKSEVLAWSKGKPLPRRVAFVKAQQVLIVNGKRVRKQWSVRVELDTKKVYVTDTGECPEEAPSRRAKADGGAATKFDEHKDALPFFGLGRPKRLFKPATIERPQGVSFKVNKRQVSWGNWTFHAHIHPRTGLVISQAKISGRSVLYQGSLSELFTPYMGPTGFFLRSLNVAQFGIGANTKPLIPLTDCPKNSVYLYALIPNPVADNDVFPSDPLVIPNAICIFERYSADVANRHFDSFYADDLNSTAYSAEPRISLVVRSWAVLRGNEDFGIDWEFFADGTIKTSVNIAGTPFFGIASEKRDLRAANINPLKDGEDGLYGTYVSPFVVASIYDHYANFRLDVDIETVNNNFVMAALTRKRLNPLPSYTQRTSIYEVVRKTAVTELDGKYNISTFTPADYVITSPGKRTLLGNVFGYKLVSHNPVASLLPPTKPEGAPGGTPGFLRNGIWVTCYDAMEKYAAGTFPFCFRPDGLPFYSQKNRVIKGRDIVVWHTIGAHHVPVQEDFPLSPPISLSFELRPHNFFESTPIATSTPYTPQELRVC